MDLHERYMRTLTIDFSIIDLLGTAFKNDPFLFLHRTVKHYNIQIMESSLSAEQLNTFRMILCYEYQLTFNSEKKQTETIPKDLCFKTVESISCIQNPIIYDIIILQLILYCSPQCIKQHFCNFQQSTNYTLYNNESKFFETKILECFLESLRLRKFLYNDLETNLLEYFCSVYLKNMILWLQMKDNIEWQLFASIIPKLISTFGSENILPTIWNCILTKVNDLKDVLSALSILTDICLSLKSETTNFVYYTLCFTQQLWLLIIQGLKSSIHQNRKQALFIMKRINDFMSTVDENTLKLKKHDIIPFICNQTREIKISINDIKQKYFLILEALEEKQHHLILPALRHLPNLVEGSIEHAMCNDCFSSIWLHLIFEKLLQHQNNIIVKQGISYVCKFPTLMYDQEFLKLFIHILNSTFLYESQIYEQEPEILNDIITLFISAKEMQPEFLNTILQIISEETWAPIPIFYMMHILRTVSSKVLNYWGNDQLIIVKYLVQKNFCMHSHILRLASQFQLIQTISMSVSKISDLYIAIDMLLEFPSGETLIRNSSSWHLVVSWLKGILEKVDVINFIRFVCKEYSWQDPFIKLCPANFALIFTMFYDCGLILQDDKCCVRHILNNWLSSLKGIESRPYANTGQIFCIIEFMSHLLNLSNMECDTSIIQLLSIYVNDAIKFLLKHSKSIPYKYDYEQINRYLKAIVLLLNNEKSVLSDKKILHYVEKFKNESITILENVKQYTNMHYMYALHILHYTQNILCTNQKTLHLQPLLTICDINISDNNDDHVQSKGKIASDCYVLLAKLTNQFFLYMDIELWPQEINWFDNISHLYEIGGIKIVPEIALILETVVNKGAVNDLQNRKNMESILTELWRTTLLSTKNKIYFSAIQNLLRVMINNNFLVLPNAMNFVNNFIDELLEEGGNVPKLKKILLNEMGLLSVCYLKDLSESLISCLLHGYVLRKDKQIENQVYLHIAKHYKDCFPEHVHIIDQNNDANIRANAVVLLHKIISEDKEYASILLPILLKKLEKYKSKRYFNHSYIHKIKHRIMQVLLIIQPTLTQEDTILLQEFLSNIILLESNQHSVRIMQEWLLVKIFVDNVEFHNNLWELFKKGITARPGCVSSLACIVYHVSKMLPKDCQSNFIVTGLNYIAQCCLGQKYSMRLYSQIIFVKLYEMLEGTNFDHFLLQYKGLYDATIANLKNGLAKNSHKVQGDFYLSTFHALQHYSLQTIYFELPRLTDMDASEWIAPYLFKNLNFQNVIDHPLQLYNVDTVLSDTKTSSYLIKSLGDTELSAKISNTDFDELRDIQKKIIPLMSTNLSHINISSTIRESFSHKRSSVDEEGLIVVACLVSRTPNLGGLARTCEIFNVKELVIDNLNQIKDKDFQNLSVSAENWITITETKPHELSKYLLNKKEIGWYVVGVEQTANSTNLLNMKFQKKTILVLGNEKDGIPANLIPLFDTCIEIPQIGVIRSLNVHVSGAICIWQYAKQHVLV